MNKKNTFNFLMLAFVIISIMVCNSCKQSNIVDQDLLPEHIHSKDIGIIDDAFLHGYVHNIIYETVEGKQLPTLTIQCTTNSIHREGEDFEPLRENFSVWTRDLYWGFLGWAQAGDDRVLDMMKSSIKILIEAKNRNQALGQSELWPLNNKRFYIPQAFTTGLKSALNLYPWCSESQADFLLLCHNYWKLSGDIKFIESIWNDIEYVIETLELLDTNGNSLPDAIQGSYDYMWIKEDSEEALMCAKTSLAFQSVAILANELGINAYSDHLKDLSNKIKETMNKTIDNGGLWSEDENGGYYVQSRIITKGKERIEDMFIPYNNLVPMWCGMTSSQQKTKIFKKLDDNFENVYDLKYGPMYCATAGKNEESVMDCSSVTWLAFLDVYLRGKSGHEKNRSKIFDMLMEHMNDAGGVPFPEGAGVYGYLTGGAGRSWDNGNFFHMLISGVYGIQKDKDWIMISAPDPLENYPLTELQNLKWKNANYNIYWKGIGDEIVNVSLDGEELISNGGSYFLNEKAGTHKVEINLRTK